MTERVGFIGLGAMGTAMAWNIHRAGFPLRVFNRTAERTQAFGDAGIPAYSAPALLGGDSDLVVIMVSDDAALEAVLSGDSGLLAGLGRGQMLINMATVSPEATQEAAQQVHAMGARFVDAPVSGTVKPAEEGTLVVLAGALESDLDRARPVLEAMAKTVLHCGDVGQGTRMKLVINLMLGNLMQALAEGLSLGRALELNPERVLEAIGSGPLAAPLFQGKGANILAGDFTSQFPVDLLSKDLGLVSQAARQVRLPLPQTAATGEMVNAARGLGLGEEDMAALIKVLERLSPTQVRP